ncbi:MAG: DUF4147 domain-containing protein [Candidatus Micrarchaeota archaeon]
MVAIIEKESLALDGENPQNRHLMLDACEFAMNSVLPDALLLNKIRFEKNTLQVMNRRFKVLGKIFVIGTGKASGNMAQTIEKILPIEKGVVSVPKGSAKSYSCKKIELIDASHPFPDEGSVLAAKKMIALSSEVTEKDIVICLISGGGSSLLSLPEEGLTLDEKISIVKKVMKAGADITELNNVRKSLSAIKGGKLAMHFKKAKIINLVLSDVLGNPLETIASGPTVPGEYTYFDAKEVLEKYGFWDLETPYCKIIERGIMVGKLPLNFKKTRSIISNFILGDNSLAVKFAADFLKSRGIFVKTYQNISGDAKTMGKKFAYLLNKGESFVAGGETTVHVRGDGLGGRNQEFALSAAMHIRKGTLLSVGTDGVDGVSQAAGAIVDPQTKTLAIGKKLSINEYLNNNDSYSFFQKIRNCSIITGPTGTNVLTS